MQHTYARSKKRTCTVYANVSVTRWYKHSRAPFSQASIAIHLDTSIIPAFTSRHNQYKILIQQLCTVRVQFMIALCNTADHIYFHPVVCSSYGRPMQQGGITFLPCSFFMAALCNRGAIIFLPCSFFPSSFFYLFFPRLISAAVDRMSAILLHMAWPQCEFRMQV